MNEVAKGPPNKIPADRFEAGQRKQWMKKEDDASTPVCDGMSEDETRLQMFLALLNTFKSTEVT